MSGKTGQKCEQSGVYYCQKHTTYEIPLSKGETFPPCNSCGGATTWILRRKA